MTPFSVFFTAILILAVFGILTSFFTVTQQTAGIVERFGKFVRIALPGLNFKLPWLETVRGKVSLRVKQLDVPVETKTQDNVFVRIGVSVQYHFSSPFARHLK